MSRQTSAEAGWTSFKVDWQGEGISGWLGGVGTRQVYLRQKIEPRDCWIDQVVGRTEATGLTVDVSIWSKVSIMNFHPFVRHAFVRYEFEELASEWLWARLSRPGLVIRFAAGEIRLVAQRAVPRGRRGRTNLTIYVSGFYQPPEASEPSLLFPEIFTLSLRKAQYLDAEFSAQVTPLNEILFSLTTPGQRSLSDQDKKVITELRDERDVVEAQIQTIVDEIAVELRSEFPYETPFWDEWLAELNSQMMKPESASGTQKPARGTAKKFTRNRAKLAIAEKNRNPKVSYLAAASAINRKLHESNGQLLRNILRLHEGQELTKEDIRNAIRRMQYVEGPERWPWEQVEGDEDVTDQ